jgi:hypothetical protein
MIFLFIPLCSNGVDSSCASQGGPSVRVGRDHNSATPPSSEAEDKEEDDKEDKFADAEVQMLMAQAGNNALLPDCAVREVVAHTIFDLVDEAVQGIEPPAKEKRVEMHSFFTKRLAGDPPWRTTQRLPKVGMDKELDLLIKTL